MVEFGTPVPNLSHITPMQSNINAEAVDKSFEKCVFINCPFDKDFEPILYAIMFTVVFMGLTPRLASETNDSEDTRLEKYLN